jgi:hypothetical protein
MNFLATLQARLKRGFAPDLNFEKKWVVAVSDTQVSCTRPNGKVETLNWDDLKIVVIETTDEGPYAPDVFWYLAGEQTGCVIPHGATGDDVMEKRLQALPGFDNEAFIEAMTSTSNRKFILWQRTGAT